MYAFVCIICVHKNGFSFCFEFGFLMHQFDELLLQNIIYSHEISSSDISI